MVVKQLTKKFYGKEHPIVEALIVVTNHTKLGNTDKKTGWYLSEVAQPYYKLHASAYKITFASPKGGLAPVDPNSVSGADEVSTYFHTKVCDTEGRLDTVAVSALNLSKYHIIVFAGGHGTMWDFPKDQILQKAGETIYNNGGILASICHGVSALINMKTKDNKPLIAGKKLTGFSNKEEAELKLQSEMPFSLEDELIKNGAKFNKAECWKCNVVVDGNLITGQNGTSADLMGDEIIKAVNHHILK